MFEKLLPVRKEKAQLGLRGPRDLFSALDEFFGTPWGRWPGAWGETWKDFPAVDLSETETEIVVKAEMPGVDVSEMDLSIDNGHLLIKGEKKMESEEKEENYHCIERSYGSFTRSVRLPALVDESGVKADYKKGVLTVRLPKTESAKRRRIEIETE